MPKKFIYKKGREKKLNQPGLTWLTPPPRDMRSWLKKIRLSKEEPSKK